MQEMNITKTKGCRFWVGRRSLRRSCWQWQFELVWDGIHTILSDGQIAAAQAVQESQNADSANNNSTTDNNPTNSGINNHNNNNNVRGSPTVSLLTADDNRTSKYRKSPATMMTEASLLSKEEALKEAENFKADDWGLERRDATPETGCWVASGRVQEWDTSVASRERKQHQSVIWFYILNK